MSRLFRRGVNDSPEHTARYQCTSLTRCWLAFDYPMIGYSFLRLSSTSPGNCSFTQKRGPLSLQRARSLTCSLFFEKEILATIYILGGGGHCTLCIFPPAFCVSRKTCHTCDFFSQKISYVKSLHNLHAFPLEFR